VWCGYEVPGMMLLRYFKGAMLLDHNKDMPIHVSTCTSYDLNAINASCVEVMTLIKHVFFYVSLQQ
jgi:hypothetical protein